MTVIREDKLGRLIQWAAFFSKSHGEEISKSFVGKQKGVLFQLIAATGTDILGLTRASNGKPRCFSRQIHGLR